MTLLEVENLQVSFDTYAGTVQAVRGIDLAVGAGETVAIVGESGCGKSVTAQAIMGLTEGRVSADHMTFAGEDLLALDKKGLQRIRANEIGIVFQDPMTSLNPTMKVGKQITEGLADPTWAIEALEMVGIDDAERRMNQYPHQFSGGMRQRVMIAIALACKPKLIIADEPTTALDVTTQAQILKLLKDIQEKTGTSILLITHDLGIVHEMCDKIVVMYAGKAVETGTVEEIFNHPQHPYTHALLKAVPRLGTKHLEAIKGSPPDLLAPPEGCAFWTRCKHAMAVCQQVVPPFDLARHEHRAACWLHHEHAKALQPKYIREDS